MAPFTAAKAAIEMLLRCLAHELAPHGVSTTAIALPTILTEKVRRAKPSGDHENYITPEEVAVHILNDVFSQPGLVTGNISRLIKHSETFYGQGYFERNPRQT
jgi:NAD(P)-dependent dehydrogenase (short-subunit alcohol dehydrogenase family)